MAGIDKAINAVAKGAAKVATQGKIASEVVEGAGKAVSEATKQTVKKTGQAFNEAVANSARNMAEKEGSGIVSEAVRNVGKKNLEKQSLKALSNIDDIASLTKKELQQHANDLGLSFKSKTKKQDLVNMINDKVKSGVVNNTERVAERAANRAARIDTVKGTFSNIHKTLSSGASSSVVENAVDQIEEQAGNGLKKKVSNGIRKNALIGGAVGSVTGAGIGGVTAMATGADEDDTKSMILMGALAGGTAGSIAGAGSKMIRNKQATGSMFQQAAEEMSKHGGKNLPVGGGAEGLIEKVKNGGTNITDKIDDIGGNISNKLNARKERLLRNEVLEGLEKQGFDTIDAVELSQGIFGDSKISKDLAAYGKKAGLLGGSAQGAIMGSAGGALIGGISGGIDEDESFIGGALKGGLIGGTLGGIGGGASGYFNSSGRVLSNTVENIGSLFA